MILLITDQDGRELVGRCGSIQEVERHKGSTIQEIEFTYANRLNTIHTDKVDLNKCRVEILPDPV